MKLFKRSDKFESPYYCRIKCRGKTTERQLDTNVLAIAMTRAKDLKKALRGEKWEKLSEALDPSKAIRTICKLGDIFTAYRSVPLLEPKTTKDNIYSVGSIIKKVYGAGAEVEAMSATYLTGDLIKKYQEAVVAAAGDDHIKRDTAMRTANSTLRQARSLFSKGRTNRFANIYEKLSMPDLNDFMQFPYLRATKKLYSAPPPGLVEKTWEESAKLKITAPNLYLAFLLGACAGLRRKEIAYARRSWFSARTLGNGRRAVVVEVMTEADFRPKGKRKRDIPVSPFVLDEIMKLRGELLPTDYIMPQEGTPRDGLETIRCQKTFAVFNKWMTGIGWETRMKLHELRKFFGALVAEQFGIYTAKEFLGHASVTTTEDSYSTMLNRKGNVVDVEGDYGIKISTNNGTCCDQWAQLGSTLPNVKFCPWCGKAK